MASIRPNMLYPDTRGGVFELLKRLLKSKLVDTNIDRFNMKKDPYLCGVWHLHHSFANVKYTVMMAGYPNSDGSVREVNELESVGSL